MSLTYQFAKMKIVNFTCSINHVRFLLTSPATYRTNTYPPTETVLCHCLVTFCYVSIHVSIHNV